MRTDRELLAAYLEGDDAAFERFYRRHRRQVFVLLLSHVRRRDVAEEILQEVFVEVVSRLRRLLRGRSDAGTFRPYLLAVARSRAVDELRRDQRRRRTLRRAADEWRRERLFKERSEGAMRNAPPIDPEEVDLVLAHIPAEQREVIVLRLLAGLTFREVAEVTGASENTVVSRYRYGLEKLRAGLGLEAVRGGSPQERRPR